MLETGKFEELLNCITWGYTDFLKQQYLLTIENPTEYNVANLASLGIVGMINSAVNPEKTGSPEQVMSIVGIAALGKGAQAGIAGKGGTAAITTKTVVKGPVKPKVKGSGNAIQGGKGYNNFDAFKKEMGAAGDGKAWHHIVEQNQIQKSGFSAQQVHNTNNLIAVESGFKGSIHSKISGYYNSIESKRLACWTKLRNSISIRT